ncbi:MAG TPA: hypothetical protein VGH29_03475, partial [Candidatus Binataceae bacterium]
PLSPVWLVLGSYLLFAILGRYALGLGSGVPGQAFLFHMRVKTLDDTLAWMLLIMIAFAAGAQLHLFLFPAAALPIAFGQSRPYRHGALLVTGAALALLLLIAGIGVHKIFYRIEYLTNRESIIYKVGKILSPLGVATCGYASLSSEKAFVRKTAMLVAFIYFVVMFAMASRMMALAPTLFALGCFCARPQSRGVRTILYLSFLTSPVLVPIPLAMRHLPIKGLIPFTAELGKIGRIFGVSGVFKHVVGSILISFPLTGYVGNGHRLRFDYLLTAANPLPGLFTNWRAIQGRLMVNTFTPYNGLGELMNYGPTVGVTCYLLLGMYFSHVDRRIRRWMAQGRALPGLVLFGLAALLVLMSLQYNLRTNFRLVYYALGFEATMIIWGEERIGYLSYALRQSYPGGQEAT